MQGVASSNPATPTIYIKDLASKGAKSFFFFLICAQHCAQQLELVGAVVWVAVQSIEGGWLSPPLYAHTSLYLLEHVRWCDVEGIT